MSDSTSQTQHSDHSDSSDIPGRLDFGSICSEYGCATVHPAEDHEAYVARYQHSASCPACATNDQYNIKHACHICGGRFSHQSNCYLLSC